MKGIATSTCILLILLSCSARSQEYSYTHYDISEGLAGSVVYCITQDKDGFIWTGTETGVSRFDGTHFRNFTVAEGLPDIEVLNMLGDSKGRVWMAPFRKSICYYYQGKVYNQENDSLLHRIHLRDNVMGFAEDAAGDILVQEPACLLLITAGGKIREYDSIAGRPIQTCTAVSKSAGGYFLVRENQQIYELTGAGFQPFGSTPAPIVGYIAMNATGVMWRSGLAVTTIHSFKTGKTVSFPFEETHYRYTNYSVVDDSLFYFNENQGSTEYNINTGESKHFLPGREISRTFRDVMGNIWFTTLGQGIYRLNSDEFRTIGMNVPGMERSSIHAIKKLDSELLAGDNHNYIFHFSPRDMVLRRSAGINGRNRNRILDLGRSPRGNYWVASDHGMEEGTIDGRRKSFKPIGVKFVWPRNANELIVSTNWGVGLFDLRRFEFVDTLWRERSTIVFLRRDTLYIGTLNGLYVLPPDRSPVFLGKDISFLQKRISGLAESADGTLWIASYDAGAVGYKDGRIIATLNKASGLTSDICRTLLVQNNILWLGTDKGLNRIDLNEPGYPVKQYNSNDGLGSDMINCMYADSSVIYVGTPAGLSYFNETKVNHTEGCIFHLMSIVNSGRERIGDTAHLLIPYSDKHVRFEFAGISYRSVGGILYRYRMATLDTGWQETKETFLEYPTLPSGKYVFQMQAINKFGNRSALLSLPFEVVTPFWQTGWFYGFIVVAFLLLTWLFVNLRIKSIRRRQREREELTHRMAEMENTALQAQMNPHFIFNCLNSIQQYVFDQEVLAANKYLTGFARLIRATLHNSSRNFISLADEIDYLSTYLSLEKLRFKEKMDYVIETDPSINLSQYIIPPMLIQPFVENSMRHGLRHKTTGKGYICITISLSANKLLVAVEDNGIGRKQAAAYKTREHIEYQSKGMSLTADRIRMMNVKYNDSIRIEVADLQDSAGQPAGTRVVMQFPLFHTTPQQETI